eukprot:jgi/Orpsp1_1/1182948/evm.model.c7180000083248.1
MNGNGLFVKFWDSGVQLQYLENNFYLTPMPGKKKGINAAITGGMNIGINKYISNEKINATKTVLEYLTSEKVQKDIVIKKYRLYTGITKLYDDEEVCSILSCSFIKKAQSIGRKFENVIDYDLYTNKIVKLFNQFMYSNRTAEEVLTEIEDITAIHYITVKSNLMIFIIIIGLDCLLVNAFIILSLNKLSKIFSFFTTDLRFIYFLGYIVVISSEFLQFGELSDMKCQIRLSMMLTGSYMVYITIAYKLLVCFPETNKYSNYLHRNKYLFLAICIGIEILINLLFLFSPYSKEIKMFENTALYKNFSKCTMKNNFGNYILLIDMILK